MAMGGGYCCWYHQYTDNGFVHAVNLAIFEQRALVCLQGWRPEAGMNGDQLLFEESGWHGSWKVYNFGGQYWIHVKMNWQGDETRLRSHLIPYRNFRIYRVGMRINPQLGDAETEWEVL